MDDETIDPRVKGGIARRDALSPERRQEIGRKGAEARWNSGMPRATHEGVIEIGAAEIVCAVLEDGQRVLTQSSFMKALGRSRQAKGRQYFASDADMPAFLTAHNLKPFISNDLAVSSSQIEFRPLKGGRAFGYSADLLPLVCEVFLDALEAKKVLKSQMHIAERAKILHRGLSRVGIAGLVDEATGYQEVRDRMALRAILDTYVSKELAAWEKRFPDDFYREMYRLRGWEWKSGTTKRTHAVAQYTKDLVYMRIAPELLAALEKLNPTDEKGHRKAHHHRWLSVDVGQPALAQHFIALLALMKAADTWDQFKAMVKRSLPYVSKVDDLPMFRTMSDPNVPAQLSSQSQSAPST